MAYQLHTVWRYYNLPLSVRRWFEVRCSVVKFADYLPDLAQARQVQIWHAVGQPAGNKLKDLPAAVVESKRAGSSGKPARAEVVKQCLNCRPPWPSRLADGVADANNPGGHVPASERLFLRRVHPLRIRPARKMLSRRGIGRAESAA